MNRPKEAGFTLLELVMVIVIIGILGSVAVRSADFALDRNRYFATVEEMKLLGHAIAGNPDLVSAGKRTDFGYVGDMGSLPGNLGALLTDQGGTWAGPYVVNPVEEDNDAFKMDAWNQAYTYPAGSAVKISSGGGGEPVTHQFAPSEASLISNSVAGTITDWNGANPAVSDLSNITVTVHHPSGGSMTTSGTAPQAGGVFAIGGIPVGIHRVVATHSVLADSAVKVVTVTPGSSPNVDLRFNATLPGTGGEGAGGGSLEYVPGSATTFDSGNRSVRFRVQNSGDSPVGMSSLTAVYTSSPVAYYEEVDWNYLTTLWQSTTPRNGSGDTASFSERGLPSGSSVTLELEDFRNSPAGGGGNVNMSGVDFEITFSDGSVITFTTP